MENEKKQHEEKKTENLDADKKTPVTDEKKVVESDKKTSEKEVKKAPEKSDIVKVTIVQFTAFNSLGETTFFNKTMDEVRFELHEGCNTVVIHKTIEYELSVTSKVETEVNKVVELTSRYEENTFDLLKARRRVLNVAKSVVNKKTMGKLLKVSEKLDDVIMHEKLD
jgi:hypothetical protein